MSLYIYDICIICLFRYIHIYIYTYSYIYIHTYVYIPWICVVRFSYYLSCLYTCRVKTRRFFSKAVLFGNGPLPIGMAATVDPPFRVEGTGILIGKDLVLDGPRLEIEDKQLPGMCCIDKFMYIFICVYIYLYMYYTV